MLADCVLTMPSWDICQQDWHGQLHAVRCWDLQCGRCCWRLINVPELPHQHVHEGQRVNGMHGACHMLLLGSAQLIRPLCSWPPADMACV